MNATPGDTPRDEIIRLLFDVADGSATPIQTARLDALLRDSHEARVAFLCHVELLGNLYWDSRSDSQIELAHASELGETDLLEAVSGLKSEIRNRKSEIPMSPVLGFLSRSSALLSKPVLWSILAAGLAFFCYVAVITWGIRSEKAPHGTDGADSLATLSTEAVGTISDTADVKWSKESKPKTEAAVVRKSELLKIDSGLIELKLKQGATLVVEGPASWSIDGDNRATLHAGKLVANVPKQAIGFTLDTLTAKIVDLGTEFGVKADGQGATEVEVLAGKVELHPESPRGNSLPISRPIVLSKGDAVKVEPGQAGASPIVNHIAPATNQYIRRVSKTAIRRIPVREVIASSENGGFQANALINGSGMQDDCHATYHPEDGNKLPPYHMWLTEYGKFKNEFVLFDLGKPYRIQGMKVWNFNDGRNDMHLSRGLRQADIYVSTSGKSDPVTEPTEWKLVVEDFKFSLATGTDNYHTPDVILLRDAEAQFVAIVIDDDPSLDEQTAGRRHCVGLSEVQFFSAPDLISQPRTNAK